MESVIRFHYKKQSTTDNNWSLFVDILFSSIGFAFAYLAANIVLGLN